jgi:hypothetical protein
MRRQPDRRDDADPHAGQDDRHPDDDRERDSHTESDADADSGPDAAPVRARRDPRERAAREHARSQPADHQR